MPNQDYTKFANPVEQVEAPTPVEETEPEVEKVIFGVVTNCALLNVRKNPAIDAAVIATIARDSEVEIDENESTEDFYKVCTATGVEGYCMKPYIEVEG